MKSRQALAFWIIGSAFLVLLNGLAYAYSWYWYYHQLDVPMHFLGGTTLGAFLVWFGKDEARWWSVLGIALIVGVGWELFEFKFSHFLPVVVQLKTLPVWQKGLMDSFSDVLFGLLGALSAYAILIYGRNKEVEA